MVSGCPVFSCAASSRIMALHKTPYCPPPTSHAGDPVEHQVLHPYGVGIDTHSKFIQVCILFRAAGCDTGGIKRLERTFLTTFSDLQRAHGWTLRVLTGLAEPQTLRYCIESTGTYHCPVLIAWGGIPSVVNPLLAGPTRRKTDVLDARLLAHHSIGQVLV